MITVNNKTLEEKLGQLRKAMEIVGGKDEITAKFNDNDAIVNYIIERFLEGKEAKFNINNKEYYMNELLAIKLEYEKYYLKNKVKSIDSIVYKIKKYDTSLDSLIRKYKKSRGIEEYNKIFDTLEKTYRRDINIIILKEIDLEVVESLIAGEEVKFYGEYLLQKKKALLDGVISKMGIV